MAQMSQWFCQELLRTAFNRDTYVPAYTNLAVALVSVVPPINVDITQLGEPTIGGYARVVIPYNTANWGLTGYREVFNNLAINYPAATDFWGQMEGYVVLSAAGSVAVPDYTASMTVAVGRLVQPLRVIAGIQPSLPIAAVSFGLYDSAP